MMYSSFIKRNPLYLIVISLILILGVIIRIILFDIPGGDYVTYKNAMEDLSNGINFYTKTVSSFQDDSNLSEHGYAYFPTLLYIQYGIWKISNLFPIVVSTIFLWKIPTLLADLVIFYFLLKRSFNSNKYLGLFLGSLWFFNPYLISRLDYNLYDPLFLVFTILSLNYLEKDTIKSGLFYGIALSLKTIPLILFPLFLVHLYKKNKQEIIKFLAPIFIFFFLISIPFMKSYQDFSDYINGSFFVHSERGVQGRPVLTFISYLTYEYGLRFYQNEFSNIYAVAALLSALFVPLFLYFKKGFKNKYIWAMFSFGIYLFLTPVLNRTHILWFFVFFLLSVPDWNLRKIKKYTYIILVWLILTTYLFFWNKGFDNNFFQKENPVSSSKTNYEYIDHILRNKFYEIRGNIFKP